MSAFEDFEVTEVVEMEPGGSPIVDNEQVELGQGDLGGVHQRAPQRCREDLADRRETMLLAAPAAI